MLIKYCNELLHSETDGRKTQKQSPGVSWGAATPNLHDLTQNVYGIFGNYHIGS